MRRHNPYSTRQRAKQRVLYCLAGIFLRANSAVSGESSQAVSGERSIEFQMADPWIEQDRRLAEGKRLLSWLQKTNIVVVSPGRLVNAVWQCTTSFRCLHIIARINYLLIFQSSAEANDQFLRLPLQRTGTYPEFTRSLLLAETFNSLFSNCPWCTMFAPQILHKLLLWNTLGRSAYSQEHSATIVYAKFGGQTECIMGNWKVGNGVEFCLPNEDISVDKFALV